MCYKILPMSQVYKSLDNGVQREEVLQRLTNDTRLEPHMLRDLCFRLQIPLSRFGLLLTEGTYTEWLTAVSETERELW